MTRPVKIAIVDDEPNIVEVARLYLEHAGFIPLTMNSGKPLLECLEKDEPSLILLDVMLPDISGFDLCQQIRKLPSDKSQIPIILLTARGESMDKLRGFNSGVDDYIVKPFDPNELIARVKAILRRSTGGPNQTLVEKTSISKRKCLEFQHLTIDLDQYKVIINGQRAELTPKEIELLYFLASNSGRVFTREDLLIQVWQFDFNGGTRTVDAHVKNLRKKLGTHDDWSIQTLWGIGYSFEVNKLA